MGSTRAASGRLHSLPARLAALLALFALLAVLLVWFGSLGPAPALGAYPDSGDLAADYDRYVGERVVVAGEVVDADPTVVRVESAAHPDLLVTVGNLDADAQPEPGDLLRAFGVARPDATVEATNAFTVPRTGLRYTWSVSFLAGLWVLGRILNYWRVDTADWTLRARTTTWLRARREGD